MKSTLAKEWQLSGQYLTVAGKQLFYVEKNPQCALKVVLLHGFPCSGFDFMHVLPEFASRVHVVVHDHLGFGLSDKPKGHKYSILEQADLAVATWLALGLSQVHVVAHDYGVSVALELVLRQSQGILPIHISSLTLTNSGVIYRLAKLRWVQHALRIPWLRPFSRLFTSKQLYQRGLRGLSVNPKAISTQQLDALWQLTCLQNGHRKLADISQYLEERRYIHCQRWETAIASCTIPTLILWGDSDPIGTAQIATVLHGSMPNSTLQWLHGVGHFPMYEDGLNWSKQILAFVERVAKPMQDIKRSGY